MNQHEFFNSFLCCLQKFVPDHLKSTFDNKQNIIRNILCDFKDMNGIKKIFQMPNNGTLLRCRLAKTQFSDRYQTIRYTLLKNKKETDCVAKINTRG